MSEEELKKEVIVIAENFDGNVEINRHLSYVAVGDFYTQGEDAANLINEIEDLAQRLSISEREAAIFIVDNM